MHNDAELPSDAQIGVVVAGKYRIDRILGVGGVGIVVAAHHLLLDERVAIKFLLPSAVQDPEMEERFSREARAAVKIKSEHVARVFDVGSLRSGALYLVMEYLEGCDVSALMRMHGALPVEQAVGFILEACEAIAEAHGLGIVHRDLKPENLYCTRRSDGGELIKVLDFGISKVTSRFPSTNAHLTLGNVVFGSPLYMSPEQIVNSHDVDERTDIWSLGVSLYEMLTLRPPFEADSIPDVFVRTSSQPPLSLHSYRSDIPPELEVAVFKCLEKDRNRRYSNVAELAVALAPFAPSCCRESVEHIGRIIQAYGLAVTAVALPSSSQRPTMQASCETSTARSYTIPPLRSGAEKRRSWLFAGVVVAGIIVASVLLTTGRFATEKDVDVVASTAASSIPKSHSPPTIRVEPVVDVGVVSVVPVSSAALVDVCSKAKSSRTESEPSARRAAIVSNQVAKPKSVSMSTEPKRPGAAKREASLLDRQH